MDTASTSESVTLMLPNADLSFLRTLSKKMGWTFRRHRKTGIEKGLDDIKKGKVYHNDYPLSYHQYFGIASWQFAGKLVSLHCHL